MMVGFHRVYEETLPTWTVPGMEEASSSQGVEIQRVTRGQGPELEVGHWLAHSALV